MQNQERIHEMLSFVFTCNSASLQTLFGINVFSKSLQIKTKGIRKMRVEGPRLKKAERWNLAMHNWHGLSGDLKYSVIRKAWNSSISLCVLSSRSQYWWQKEGKRLSDCSQLLFEVSNDSHYRSLQFFNLETSNWAQTVLIQTLSLSSRNKYVETITLSFRTNILYFTGTTVDSWYQPYKLTLNISLSSKWLGYDLNKSKT